MHNAYIEIICMHIHIEKITYMSLSNNKDWKLSFRNFEGSEILPYLQGNRLTHWFQGYLLAEDPRLLGQRQESLLLMATPRVS